MYQQAAAVVGAVLLEAKNARTAIRKMNIMFACLIPPHVFLAIILFTLDNNVRKYLTDI